VLTIGQTGHSFHSVGAYIENAGPVVDDMILQLTVVVSTYVLILLGSFISIIMQDFHPTI